MLHREILRPEAAQLFDLLACAPEMAGLTLMGGTALALQIGHRISLDFDFAVFVDKLPTARLDGLASRLKSEGHQCMLITSPDAISTFKINTGKRLLDYARDYVIDGVKTTFFAHGKTPRQRDYYRQAATLDIPEIQFAILAAQALKAAKTLVLADRVRSRDLYDLYTLMRDHGYTLDELFATVKELGVVDDPEHYKAVMRGEIPLDKDDEGLEPVEVTATIETVYAHFQRWLAEYETERAHRYFARTNRAGD
jgi:hypothetical protein